jgi:cephalosporin-C deacetylase
MLTDLDRDGLTRYRSHYQAPPDFDDFWRTTLASAGDDIAVRLVPVETNLVTVDVFDMTLAGFGGDPIKAWLRVPRHRTEPLPAIVGFNGYGAGRGAPLDDLLWSSAGYAHLLMETRDQGGAHTGFLTNGIQDKETYYYRRVFTDAVRAVEAVRTLDLVDPTRVAAVGNSQGGGIALAVAGLVPDLAALYVQAPFLCDIRRATMITDAEPYSELVEYLATKRNSIDDVFATLSYFDGVGFASRANAPAWFATGLMDAMCPPSTAFGAFHVYRGPKQIRVWDYNGHEAGGAADLDIVLTGFRPLLQRVRETV